MPGATFRRPATGIIDQGRRARTEMSAHEAGGCWPAGRRAGGESVAPGARGAGWRPPSGQAGPRCAGVDRSRRPRVADRQRGVSSSGPGTPASAASAAAAFSSAVSRTGPGSPPRRPGPRRRCAPRRRPRRSSGRDRAIPSSAGSNLVCADRPVVHHPDQRRAGRGQLVQPVARRGRPARSCRGWPARRPAPGPSAGRRPPRPARPGRAGLATGPRKLKTVGTPSSRRGTEVCRQRRVIERREQERERRPRRPAARSRPAAGRSPRRAPPARRRSPQAEEAARLPCLTIRAPAAAAAIVPMVEMLTVRAASPPVPTRSTSTAGDRDRRGVRQASPGPGR